MEEQLLHHYSTTVPMYHLPQPVLRMHSVDGMYIETIGTSKRNYQVNFINSATDETMYTTYIGNNCWARSSVKYHIDWKITVQDLNMGHTFSFPFVLKDKRVYIALDSKSLGDTLAWIPYVEEFRKVHQCKVICSTFWNDMFMSTYPDIEFVTAGTRVDNLAAMYTMGFFYREDGEVDYTRHPRDPKTVPLQRVASDILGLQYTEIKPRLNLPSVERDNKLVTIAIHSTSQAKYWNNPLGWQMVVDWLVERDYTVKLLSREGMEYMGNTAPKNVIHHPNGSIDSVVEELMKSTLFIGLGSGLSWLSWAVGTPTMVISGFSDPFTEMQDCIRISAPENTCTSCFNRVRLDPADWNWCPDHKNTPRQFECSRNISPYTVIAKLIELGFSY